MQPVHKLLQLAHVLINFNFIFNYNIYILIHNKACKGLFRSANVPNCECLAGYYDDNAGEDCIACNYKCYSCVTAPTTCTACRDPTHRKLPLCNCEEGYFDVGDGIEAMCGKCHHKCKACSDASTCTTCHGADRDTSPPCNCNTGYFDNGTINCVSNYYLYFD